eukprot:CAMPEP_0181100794 /NCGR_PEP_ID=MMETSP1071-20121207/13389_1 /TAXON_ID=35127 /ORGANISM="Thalassiosira sp., Strain NH16" /LENGTH=475 /DNA_ID=CAMNT_0023183559 /DNA_START=51 /DNA_END=1478 /DNA_ORIENTATION=-
MMDIVVGRSAYEDGSFLSGIKKVNDNDIICGRGRLPLKHPGNAAYRQLIGLNKELYATCLKIEKARISKSIVAAIRQSGARFLEREDGKTSTSLENDLGDEGRPVTWRDVGDRKAIEKTSQALREGQPKLLKKLANRQQQQQGVINYGVEAGTTVGARSAPPAGPILPGLDNSPLPLQQSAPAQAPLVVEQRLFANSRAPEQAPLVVGQRLFADSRHDSWGSVDLGPLPALNDLAQDSTPPIHQPGIFDGSANEDHVFSKDDHDRLMSCLSISCGESGEKIDSDPADGKQHISSVKLSRELPRYLSELSMCSFSADAKSLDSALDAAERELEFEMQGEFDGDCQMSIGTFDYTTVAPASPAHDGNGPGGAMSRRSILRKSSKWTSQSAFSPAPLNHNIDPGMLFTSTLDTRPGGINSGTDVSGLVTRERRSSVVKFEAQVTRRRSSRMSISSGIFKRDFGSMVSIRSATFRDLME